MSHLLEPDKTWTIFDNFSPDRNQFAKTFLPALYLKPAVHQDIRDNFEVIQKLLEHSYYVYKFYDVAVLKSLLTLEMALRIEYKKKTKEDWGRKSLNSLMKWFEEKNHFEVYNKDFLNHVRSIRNLLAHASQHTISGSSRKPIIENVIDLINGLYENPSLRLKRMKLTSKIINELHRYTKGIKCTLNDKTDFAISAWPAFINNKKKPSEIHFYVHPTFDVPEANTNWMVPPTIHFVGVSIKFTVEGITLKDKDGQTLLISEVTDPDEKARYDNWMENYESYTSPGLGGYWDGTKVVDTFSLHLREFNKEEASLSL